MGVFYDDLKDYKRKIDDIISSEKALRIFKEYNAGNFMDEYYNLFLEYCKGGKRLRAYLVDLGYRLIANKSNEDVLLPSLSFEIFQAGILAHDDIIDKSEVRRFIPSMYVKLGNNHEAISKTICMGDLSFAVANDMLCKSNFSQECILKAIREWNNLIFFTIAGEIKDITLSNSETYEEKDIFEMYRLKTSLYTTTGPLKMGAILAKANDRELEILQKFGDNLGIAFQIKDDIIGIFGDEHKIGKSILSDMREGKKTILTSHFIKNADSESLKKFNKIYGNQNATREDLNKLKLLFNKFFSLDYAQKACIKFTQEARKAIENMELSDTNRMIVNELISYLIEREK